MSERPQPHYLGHRERLRERFRKAGAGALADYELLELLPVAGGTITALCSVYSYVRSLIGVPSRP